MNLEPTRNSLGRWTYFFRVSSLAYPNLLGKKSYVVVVYFSSFVWECRLVIYFRACTSKKCLGHDNLPAFLLKYTSRASIFASFVRENPAIIFQFICMRDADLFLSMWICKSHLCLLYRCWVQGPSSCETFMCLIN